MKKLISFTFIFFSLFSSLGWTQEMSTTIESPVPASEYRDRTLLFNPVVGVSPRTVPKWKMTFQRSALNNINSTFLANTISVGLHDRIDLGSAPVWYATDTHRFNFSLKYNFYRSEKFDAAISVARSTNEFRLSDGEKANLIMGASQASFVFHPDWLRSSVGFFGTFIDSYIEAKNPIYKALTQRFSTEYGLDWQIPLPKDQWLTFGVAQLRDLGYSSFETTSSGAGVAYSIFRKAKLFSRPSLGYYSNQTGRSYWTFSTSFYEI